MKTQTLSKTVVYNPNCIEAIFTAALLQTFGWYVLSSRELIEKNEGRFIWVSCIPTLRHFRDAKPNNAEHLCIMRYCRVKKMDHFLLKGVVYGENEVSDTVNIPGDTVVTGSTKRTLIDQIASIEGINVPETRLLSYMVSKFYKQDTSADLLAVITYNAVKALECIKTREPFYPMSADFSKGVTPELIKAHTVFKTLRAEAERSLELGSIQNKEKTNQGFRRVIRTYQTDMWWFLRRSFKPDDLGFNFSISATGPTVDATTNFVYDFGLPDPVVIVL